MGAYKIRGPVLGFLHGRSHYFIGLIGAPDFLKIK